MPLNIKSETADRLARELADLTGESITEAVTHALEDRLERERRGRNAARRAARTAAIQAIFERAGKLPVLDDRSDHEILGYDKDGAFE